MHYRFNNLRNGSVYEYSTLSDTARLLKKYNIADSIRLSGGWNFKLKRKWEYNKAPEALPDSIIDGISYKVLRLSTGTEEIPYSVLFFFRCDRKGTMFNLDPLLSETVGCPLTKLSNMPLCKKGLNIATQVVFLTNLFTPEEETVFNAWEKYATKHPVKRSF